MQHSSGVGFLRILVTAVTVCLSVGVGLPAVQAGEAWNDYWIALPDFATVPIGFTVFVDGPSAICSMDYNKTTVDAAPWSFTFDPLSPSNPYVYITECDGATDWIHVETMAPYVLDRSILAVRAANQYVTVSNRTAFMATAALLDEGGAELSRVRVAPQANAELTVSLQSVKRSTLYSIVIIGDDGTDQSLPLLVAKGYAMFDFLGSTPNFAPCSTLTWGYDPTLQPAKSKTFRADIQPALDRLAKQTRLTFVYSDNYATADLRFHWGDAAGAAAIGDTEGDVEISTTHFWPRDRFTGFGPSKGPKGYARGGPGGRGWLIIHEVLHSLGFDHVKNAKSVMSPVNTGQHAFDRGTLDGMHAIYRAHCLTNSVSTASTASTSSTADSVT